MFFRIITEHICLIEQISSLNGYIICYSSDDILTTNMIFQQKKKIYIVGRSFKNKSVC